MENEQEPKEKEPKMYFIKTDNNVALNVKQIKWVKKMNECMEVCMKGNGCFVGDTHKICKSVSMSSYDQLNKYFEKNSAPDFD